MATILHIMGATCSGKSTLIDAMVACYPNEIYSLQIGKILRAKYGEAYFQGQAAPEKTKVEAMSLYLTKIQEAIDEGKKLIIVDGQPRDISQAQEISECWQSHKVEWMLLHADHAVREARAKSGRKPGPDLDLTIARLTNDYKNNYEVLVELMLRNITVEIVDTSTMIEVDIKLFAKGITDLIVVYNDVIALNRFMDENRN